MQSPRPRSIRPLIALLSLLVLLAQCTWPLPVEYTAPISPLQEIAVTGAAASVPPPASLEELLAQATLIVVGEIGPHVEFGLNCGYHQSGDPVTPCPEPLESGHSPYWYTRYTVLPEIVLRDDGSVAEGLPTYVRESGHLDDQIVIQLRGEGTPYNSGFPPAIPGDRYLFVLSPFVRPEKVATEGYAYVGLSWGRLLIDGDILRRSDSDRTPLDFGDGRGHVTVARFLEEVLGDDVITVDDLPSTGMVAVAPWSPLPTPTPYPTPDPVEALIGQFGMTRRQAIERVAWLESGGQQILDEMTKLSVRLNQDPDYLTAFRDWQLPPHLYVRMRNPDAAAFADKYLRGVSWADRVVLLDGEEPSGPTSTPWPTATPPISPALYLMQQEGMTHEEAVAHLAWMESREEEWRAEADALDQRLRREELDYHIAFVAEDPIFTFIVRLDERGPDPATFAEKYLQGVEWADRVRLEYLPNDQQPTD